MRALTLGMPHLGPSNLSEVALFRELGHWRWSDIEKACGTPTSNICDAQGTRLYATFYYLELNLPESSPLSAFKENQTLQFTSSMRRYGTTQLDGVFTLQGIPDAWARACNVFIDSAAGPSKLKVSSPASLKLSGLEELPSHPAPRNTCRHARESGRFWAPEPGWVPLEKSNLRVNYTIDPDRDLNGAGLLYFVNYLAILERAERVILAANGVDQEVIDRRSTYQRAIGYFGNARAMDALEIEISAFAPNHASGPRKFQFDYRIRRTVDQVTIAVSSSRKTALL